jgi:hypothetical protein
MVGIDERVNDLDIDDDDEAVLDELFFYDIKLCLLYELEL